VTRSRRAALVAALLASLLVATTASAYVPAAWVPRAQHIAVDYWHAVPCGGEASVAWAALDPDTNAASTWSNPISSYGAPQLNSGCVVDFNATEAFSWPMFCTVMVHEYGHLLGRRHVPDRNDVMYIYYVRPVAPCAAGSRRASAARHRRK